jgi:hypothetical protein
MDLQEALYARLIASGPLNALIGSSIHWGLRPQGRPLPAIVLTKVAPGQEWTYSGPGVTLNPWVQFDYYGDDYPSLSPIAAAAQAEMQRLTRVIIGGCIFMPPAVLVSEQWPGITPLQDGTKPHRVTQDYRFWAMPE